MSKKLSVALIAILAVAAIAFGVLFGTGLGKQADLEKAKKEIETKAEEAQAGLDSAKAEIEKLTGDLDTANSRIETLNGELTAANEQAESLNQELETAKSETAAAQELAEAADVEKSALNAELERYKVKQTELESELETNSSALSQATSELESVKADLEAKNAQLETVTGDLEETRTQLDAARNSGTVAPVTVPETEGAYDATRFFTSTLRDNGIKFNYEGLSDEKSDIVSSVWTLQDVDVKFLIIFSDNGRVFMRAFNVIDYDITNRGAVMEIVNSLNTDYLFVNWSVDDSDNSVTATYDLPALEAKDAGVIGYSAMDSMVDVVNQGMTKLKQYMK